MWSISPSPCCKTRTTTFPPGEGMGEPGARDKNRSVGFMERERKGRKNLGDFLYPAVSWRAVPRFLGPYVALDRNWKVQGFFLVLVLVTYGGRTLLGWEISPPTIGLAAFPLYQSTVLACTSVSFAPLAPRPRFRLFFPPPGTEHRTGWPT